MTKKNLLLMVLTCILGSCIAQNTKEMEKERLTYFSFDHHNTMVWHSGEKYNVSTEKDGRIHIIIDEGFPEEKDFYIDDTTIFDELDSLIKAFKMHKWHDKYQPKMEIFDGDIWSLYFKYGSDKSKGSGGYMAWPDNYHAARQAISEYFQKWRDYPIPNKEINLFQYTCKNKQGRDIEYRLERGEVEAKLFIRNAEYDTDKEITVSNDYLTELQELVNMYRLKDEYNRTTDDDSASAYRFFICYNTGDTIDFIGYYTTFVSGQTAPFLGFFDRWLPLRGNLVRFEYNYSITDFRDIKYYVIKEDEGFTLSYYDERGQHREGKMNKEDVLKLQKLVESFGLDKAKDDFMGNSTWHLFTDYDSKDIARWGGRSDDEAQHILNALTEFFAPYLQ